MAFSIKDVRLDGCLFGTPSSKDFRTTFNDRPVPDHVDLSPGCTSVENQGHIGSCTANATVGALEFLYKRRDGQAPELSRLFVYFNARRIRGMTMYDSGAQISDVMAAVLAFGACREDVWPYNPMAFAVEPSPQAFEDALKHEAIQYSRVEGVQGSIYALAEGFPVVFGTRIPQRCFEEAATTGVMPLATDEEIQMNQGGGHAMLIVGYDNRERMFIVRNSWGETWGNRGYCKIPFDLIDRCSRPESFWIIGELAKPGNFTTMRPGKPAAAPSPVEVQDTRQGGLGTTASKLRDEIRSRLNAEIADSSRKIDTLLGRTGGKNPAPSSNVESTAPCTECLGTGICHVCNGKGKGCKACHDTRQCATCGGTGFQ